MDDYEQELKDRRIKKLAEILDDKEVRLFFHDLMQDFGMLDTTFISGDQAASAYMEGRRSGALHLHRMLYNVSPDAVVQMQADALALERERANYTQEDDDDGYGN